MAFKILSFCALLAVAKAGYLSGGYAHSYATPLAYSAGHYGSTHLSAYSTPAVISKTIATAPLAYSTPLAHYSAGLHSYHSPSVYSTPVIAKSVYSAPIISKTVVSTPIIKSYAAPALHYSAPLQAHSLYSSHYSHSPLIAKSYGLGYGLGLGYSGYPGYGYGYASKYHF